jgi:hypothetical protein
VVASSAVWVIVLACSRWFALGALVCAAAVVAGFGTRPWLWLLFGARPATAGDCDAVLRAIVPIASLRGRNQPRVFVATGRRSAGWSMLATGRRHLLVSESMLASIKTGRISDEEVSAQVAYAFGQLPALGSRGVLEVELYCLPWTIVEAVLSKVALLTAAVPLLSSSWRMRPVVFGLGLLDAVHHHRWEAAVALLVLTVLSYTTGPLRRAWLRRLDALGHARVAAEGLGQGARPHRPGSRWGVAQVEVSR